MNNLLNYTHSNIARVLLQIREVKLCSVETKRHLQRIKQLLRHKIARVVGHQEQRKILVLQKAGLLVKNQVQQEVKS